MIALYGEEEFHLQLKAKFEQLDCIKLILYD